MSGLPDFNQLIFAGGGTRCFWHGGFLEVTGKLGTLAPKRIAAVSGGALSAASWISGNEQRCMEVMRAAFEENESNLASGKSNFTPHQQLYSDVVADTLGDDAIARIAEGPQFQVLLASPPRWAPSRLSSGLYALLYKADEWVRSSPHLRAPAAMGLQGVRADARQAARDGRLVELICLAATIPPVFDIGTWEGREVVDGGMLTKAPIPDPDEGNSLYLLTKAYRHLPTHPRRTYAQPSSAVEADKIDFTAPGKIADTWTQGKADAQAFWSEMGVVVADSSSG